MHNRDLYIDKIKKFINKPVIKVITGMRRVGKSCFLQLLIDEIKGQGVGSKQIIYINFDLLEFDNLRDYRALDLHIREQSAAIKKKKIYLLIDEVQEVEKWERCIESLYSDGNYDIYLTGSNANMLSSELATKISGRYVEFPIYSLSYPEFLQFTPLEKMPSDDKFKNYLIYGGFPALPHFDYDKEVIYQYISSLYSTILLKDVVKRNNLRNITLLENITRYVFDNIGNIFSSKRISDYLKSQKMSIGVETVQNYLTHLCSTYVIHKVQRYDISGKRILELYEKYYLGDISLSHSIIGYRENDISGMLENIVFLELKRRGYSVFVGKLGEYEIDFIATKDEEKFYIQVTYLLASEGTVNREFGPLLKIKDNYPKYVLSMDTIFGNDYEGIKRINLVDFLEFT
jgi:predicted AAA+ superfamily ATPase